MDKSLQEVLDMDKKEFSKYFNEEINAYNEEVVDKYNEIIENHKKNTGKILPKIPALSERQIAKELEQFNLLKIAPKTINRYRNAKTLPNDENKNAIYSYFKLLKKEKLEKLEELRNKAPFNYRKYYEVIGLYDDEDKLRLYTDNALKYMLKHFFLFCALDEYEKEFIKRIKKLSESNQIKLRVMMESFPINLCFFEQNEPSYILDKTNYYMDMLYSYQRECPQNWHTKGKKKANKENTECYEDLVVAAASSFYPIEYEIFFDNVESTIAYTMNDWYFLFLLARLGRLDECLGEYNKNSSIEIEGHPLSAREHMVWIYLDNLLEN